MVRVVVKDSAEDTQTRRRYRWLKILLAILVLLALLTAGFVLWALNPVGEIMPEAQAALESDSLVTVTQRGWLAFVPNEKPPAAGLVLYPGARVPAEAYAPLARRIAENGYLTAIVYPHLNLSILNPGAAGVVMANFSAIETWAVGGHSMGGATAAIFAANNPDAVDGLVLIAAFPGGDALADTTLPTVSIYGTVDGLAEVDEVRRSGSNLPPATRFMAIEGGNHAQFGYYGSQRGDNAATISRGEQIDQTVAAILALMQRITHQGR